MNKIVNAPIDRLIRFQQSVKEEIGGQNKFESYIGLSNGYLSNMQKKRGAITSDVILKVIQKFPDINLDWLLTGKGEMNLSAFSNESTLAKPHIGSEYAICGYPGGFSTAIKASDCENLYLPFLKDYDFSIKAKGESMINHKDPYKSIWEGDIVACKLWKSRSHIRWGEIYALSTSEGIVIKKVIPSEQTGYIQCVSFNREDGYMPYDLPIEEINDWAIVVGVISIRTDNTLA